MIGEDGGAAIRCVGAGGIVLADVGVRFVAVDLDGPADTTMMSVVHDALRRDLGRLNAALSEVPPPDPARRAAIAAHVEWMMTFLHHHHDGEDRGLWPLVRQTNPGAAELLDRMDADHHRIQPGMAKVRAAAHAYGLDDSDSAREALARALDELNAPLLVHLRSEEDDAMPVVSASITKRQWQAWDQKYNVGGKSVFQLADEGHWLMDGLDRRRYEVLIHLVPPPIRFVIIKGFARRYRIACARRWGPGVAVAPLLQ